MVACGVKKMKVLNYLLNLNNKEYLIAFGRTIFIYIFFKLISYIIVYISSKFIKKSKNRFMFHQSVNTFSRCISIILITLLWIPHLKSIMTLISIISAGITIAIRDIILNLFAGYYIKIKKPFKLEDRISINDITGDVVLINHLSFKLLEVGDGEQSNGLIVNIPNSFVFSNTLKNYNAGFKYIWDEITVRLNMDADVEKNKKELLDIINHNSVVSDIPRKMQKELKEASMDYRIYYNYLDPVIYTKVNENHIELNARFLVHPKKIRIVEDDIWSCILKKYQSKKIDLFIE